MACWDILGKATGQPVCTLLGGRYGEDFGLYRAISQESPEAMASERRRLPGRGLSPLPAQGRRRSRRGHRAHPRRAPRCCKPGDRLIADANTGWLHARRACAWSRAVRDVDVYIEQPCLTYEECLSVRRHTDHPFVLDEVIDSIDVLLRGHADRAMDVVNLKISKLGGLTQGAAGPRPVRVARHRHDARGQSGAATSSPPPSPTWPTARRRSSCSPPPTSTATSPSAPPRARRARASTAAWPPSTAPGLGVKPRMGVLGKPVVEAARFSQAALMDKPRIFLGSSGKQEKLLQALTRGLEDVAHVEPWTTSFNPGTTTLERLLELAHEVDFAAFVFARDDWTTDSPPPPAAAGSGQASPRDNVVFEAGLFGGVLGMRRTFILHASGAKLPSDLLGLTCVRYGEATTAAEMRVVNQKLRKAIENEGRVARIEGLWWQFSLTERSPREPSAVSLLRISRDRDGALEVTGRSWQEDGTLSARYWSEAAKEKKDPSGIFYYWKGERPRRPERAAAGGDGRDPDRVRRSRGRLLHDPLGRRPEASTRGRPASTCAPIPRT